MSSTQQIGQAELGALLVDPERQVLARARLREVLDTTPRTLAYMKWLERLPPSGVRTSVSIVSSFTSRTLEPFLQVEAYVSGWRADLGYVEYGQWQNALLAQQGLEPDLRAVVLLLHDFELLEAACGDVTEALARLESFLKAFRKRASTPLFVGIAEVPLTSHGLAFGEDSANGLGLCRDEFRVGVGKLVRGLGSAYVLPLESLGSNWFDRAGFLRQRSVFSHSALPTVARRIARHIACLLRPRAKVLAVDLDNTLWGGVVGEDGVEGVAIGEDWPGAAFRQFQRDVLELRKTGVLLAIVSKNNLEDARAVFATRPEMLLSWDDFSAIRVNWQDKVSNLRQIAEELGLGLDSFVFADDSPLECGYVRAALPQMQVVELGSDPSLFSERLLDTQAFDTLHISEEDRKRAAGYAAEAARKHLRSLVVDLESFLADCDLRVSIRPADRTTLHRIHQLLGKTNQFHLTLARPTREELDVAGHSGDRLFSVHLRDRFGDYGLIGVLELQPGTQVMEIANLAVSCRALGRGVEDAMVAFARESAASRGIKRLKAAWVRGPRNEQVHDYLWRVGFQGHPRSEGKVDFELAIGDGVLAYPYYIKVDTYAPTTSE